jgi:hypothetical protein
VIACLRNRFGQTNGQQRSEGLGGKRPAEQVALPLIAILYLEKRPLRLVFNALGTSTCLRRMAMAMTALAIMPLLVELMSQTKDGVILRISMESGPKAGFRLETPRNNAFPSPVKTIPCPIEVGILTGNQERRSFHGKMVALTTLTCMRRYWQLTGCSKLSHGPL